MIRTVTDKPDRTYYVVFDKRRGSFKWWHLFTSKGFDHVYLLSPIENYTLVINPLAGGCEVDVWPCSPTQAINFLPSDATAVVKCVVNYKTLLKYCPCAIMSCVSHSKYLLGVRGFFIVSPLRLYLQLLKSGAELIKCPSSMQRLER